MNEDNLDDALDRLLNSSSSVSPLIGTTQSPEQEDDMVDYSEEDNEKEFLRKETERANTMRAKTLEVKYTEGETANNAFDNPTSVTTNVVTEDEVS